VPPEDDDADDDDPERLDAELPDELPEAPGVGVDPDGDDTTGKTTATATL
jgi:hypothetical protein